MALRGASDSHTPHTVRLTNLIAVVVAALLWAPDLSSGILSSRYGASAYPGLKSCDPALPLLDDERKDLFLKLAQTKVGEKLISEYIDVYGSLDTLVLQWDSVSYSQINRKDTSRLPASAVVSTAGGQGSVVCIHLAKRLPEIEHLADLAHEMVHAARLSEAVLKGHGLTSKDFVHSRIAAVGGEADAFAAECAVKKETLGHWDHFCKPYVNADAAGVEQKRVVEDLYNGVLSASLTGETYPVMLAKQYKRMSIRRSMNGILK